jgi:hypothetical protein
MNIKPKPGRELDKAVAEAIGLESAIFRISGVHVTLQEWDELRGVEHHTYEGNMPCLQFHPSGDLNAAFAAAEKVGIFDGGDMLQKLSDGIWEVWGVHNEIGRGATPALAICAAILKLKEKADVSQEKGEPLTGNLDSLG